MKKKFIQIGLGGFGEYWCTSVLPYVTKELQTAELVAAVDINPAAFVNAIKYMGLPEAKCYTDARTALEENEADFVTIVVPPQFHEQMVDLALEHDCDILCEKPIADTMEGCCRIYRKVKAQNKKMAVTVSHRFDQPPQTMEAVLRSERYGRLTHITGRFAETYLNRLPEGNFRINMEDEYLVEWGIHHLDMLRALAGSNARTVYAKTWQPPWSRLRADTSCAVTIEMENGVHAIYEGIQENATRLNTWQDEYFRGECEFGTVVMDHQKVNVLRSTDLQSEEVIHIPLLNVMKFLGLVNTYRGMILLNAALAIPFAMFLFHGFIVTVPREIDEAGVIDGCGPLSLYFSIVFPLLKPVTITAGVLTFISSWNDFITPLYVLNDSKKWGMIISVYNFWGLYTSDWNLICAVIVLTLLPIMVVYIFAQKYIIAGMTAGSVKG